MLFLYKETIFLYKINSCLSYFGQIRRVLSVTFVRAQACCLLARVGYLGEGDKLAADRRVLARATEESRHRERQAIYLAHVRGRGMSFVGQTFA